MTIKVGDQDVIFDDEDEVFIAPFHWYLSNGYAATKYKNVTLLMHRLLKPGAEYMVIDHINGDKLDNRKSNLRVTTQSQNILSSRGFKHNTSGVRGVTYSKAARKWQAQIKINGKNNYLGVFASFDDAVKARKAAENKYIITT